VADGLSNAAAAERKNRARAFSLPALRMKTTSTNQAVPHPRQPVPTLKSKSKRTVKHEKPEKLKAFVNAAENP
jgi:hypothetical protein